MAKRWGIIISLLFFGFYLSNHHNFHQSNQAEPTNPFANLFLEAKSAIVFDPLANQILFSRSATTTRPLASLSKLLTALVAIEILPPDTPVTISATAIQGDGDSGLWVGEIWPLKELIDFTLVTSSNDGAIALAETVSRHTGVAFTNLMNDTAKRIGLQQSFFRNATGLDNDGGNFGSAEDVVRLLYYLMEKQPALLRGSQGMTSLYQSLTGQFHLATNTNPLTASLSGLLVSKTGYTETSNGNLAVVVDLGLREPVIIVVLGSSRDGRFQDVLRLATAAQRSYNREQ